MKRKKDTNSWLGYINYIRQQTYSREQLQTEGLERILHFADVSNSVFSHSIPWIYLLDYTTGKYTVVSKSMQLLLGYQSSDFLKDGLSLTLDKYQKDHLRLFNEEIFPDRLSILRKIPPAEHPNYVFSYNFRFQTKGGRYINLLQRNCFIKSDSKGNPLLSFGVITNVEHFKADNPVIQVVEKVDNTHFLGAGNQVSKKAYYIHKEDNLFTKREKEILLYVAEGLTSKAISRKLYLSEHTVIAHRRNMMEKCGAGNATELITYAVKNQLI